MNEVRLSGQKGFTLLELLIALVILAISAATLITAVRQSLTGQERLENKTFAIWLAQNELSQFHAQRAWPETGESTHAAQMAGMDWTVSLSVEATSNPDIRKIVVSPSRVGAAMPTVSLTGYLGRN